jgi:ribosomal protein L44E
MAVNHPSDLEVGFKQSSEASIIHRQSRRLKELIGGEIKPKFVPNKKIPA